MVTVTVMDREVTFPFYVVKGVSSEVILGDDFQHALGLSYEALSKTVYWSGPPPCSQGALLTAGVTTIPAHSTAPLKLKAFSAPGQPASGPGLIVSEVTCTTLPILGKDALVNLSLEGSTTILVDNLSDVELKIPRSSYIGSFERVHEAKCSEVTLDMSAAPLSTPPSGSACSSTKKSYLEESIRKQVSHLSPSLQEDYISLILKNHDVFSEDRYDLGRTTVMEHSVQLKDSEPVYVKQFRIPESHRSVLTKHLNNWLKLGVVSPSKSKYNSPIFCVPKKDGTLRPVLDFRAINDKSHVDKYSQREVQDCIDELGRAQSRIFSSLDLTAGFWQLPLEKNSRPFTSFTIPGLGSYEWNMTTMGLLGSPASFSRMMDFVMRCLSCITYQDDVLVHSKTHDQQFLELQRCFDRLRAHGLKLNVGKCSFGQVEVAYLGFTLTPEGILPGKDKTKAIEAFEPPTTLRQVREFVGLCNYFCNSIEGFFFFISSFNCINKKGR